MLGNKDVAANIAVSNLQTAKKFYEGTLGLKQVGAEGDELIAYRSGNSTLLVYRSDYAGTNKATAVTWTVGEELEGIVRALKTKGVAFEHYDMPGMTLKGEVHVAGDMKIAWFKDPDGNILSIVSG
jgi:catechol 2,3-dioxygenase-like lactoylglutathione lyase family enzyme